MKRLLLAFAIGGLACALSAAGAASNAEPKASRATSVSSAPVASPVAAAPVSMVETDPERRQRLNARLKAMIQSGKGARLSEPRPTSRVVRGRSAVRAVPTNGSMSARTSPPTQTEISTLTPPAYSGQPNRTSGGRYRPPRLDLRTAPVVPASDIECLTQAIYYEARNESEEGQAAVAEVVINRSRAGGYPRNICEVVYQRNSRTCQFTFTCDGSIGRSSVNMTAWGRAERIARSVYEGKSSLLPHSSVNYHANYVRPSWGRRLERVRQIGAHIFYGAPLRGQTTPDAMRAETSEPKSSTGLQFKRIEALDWAFALLQQPAEPAASGG